MKLASIARVFEIVGALFGCEVVKKLADGDADRTGSSCSGLSEQMFKLSKDLFDRVLGRTSITHRVADRVLKAANHGMPKSASV